VRLPELYAVVAHLRNAALWGGVFLSANSPQSHGLHAARRASYDRAIPRVSGVFSTIGAHVSIAIAD
jgi:hypothetical protein